MKKIVEKSKQECVVGKALARAIVQDRIGTVCPSEEEMAALIEKQLTQDERQWIMGHIARCERCFSYFVLSSSPSKTEKSGVVTMISKGARLNGMSRPRGWMAALGAIAAGLVLAFLFPWLKAGDMGMIKSETMYSVSTEHPAQAEQPIHGDPQLSEELLAQLDKQTQGDYKRPTDHKALAKQPTQGDSQLPAEILAQLDKQTQGDYKRPTDHIALAKQPTQSDSQLPAEILAQLDRQIQESDQSLKEHLAQAEQPRHRDIKSSMDYLAQVNRLALKRGWLSSEPLARKKDDKPLANSFIGQKYNFATLQPPVAKAFCVGTAAIDLVEASKLYNASRQSTAVERLTSLLEPQHSELVLKAIPGDGYSGEEDFSKLFVHLAEHANNQGQLSPFLLGVWVQTSRLSSDESLPTVMRLTVLDRRSEFLIDQELPRPVRDVLTRLSPIVIRGKSFSASDIKRVRELLDELNALF